MSYKVIYNKNRGDAMIGDTIKQLREKNDYTQTTLAKKLGLSRSAINAWEMGVSIPSTSYLVELAKLFSVSTDYILGLDTKENVDITFLKQDEKEIIYTLLNYFMKYHYMLDTLHSIGLEHPDEDYLEMYRKNYKLPEYLIPALENMHKIDIGELKPEDVFHPIYDTGKSSNDKKLQKSKDTDKPDTKIKKSPK